jgi:hypothetical protein
MWFARHRLTSAPAELLQSIWVCHCSRRHVQIVTVSVSFSRAHMSQVKELQDQGELALLQCEFCSLCWFSSQIMSRASEGKGHAMWYLDYEICCQAAALFRDRILTWNGAKVSPFFGRKRFHFNFIVWKEGPKDTLAWAMPRWAEVISFSGIAESTGRRLLGPWPQKSNDMALAGHVSNKYPVRKNHGTLPRSSAALSLFVGTEQDIGTPFCTASLLWGLAGAQKDQSLETLLNSRPWREPHWEAQLEWYCISWGRR